MLGLLIRYEVSCDRSAVIKQMRMSLTEHVTYKETTWNIQKCRFWPENINGRRHLADLGIDLSIS